MKGCFVVPRPVLELYDVQKDSFSFNNLAGDADYTEVMETMEQEHNKWAKRTKDKVPDNPTLDGFRRVKGTRL